MKRYRDLPGDGGSDIVGQVEAQQARLARRLKSVRFVVAVVSGKGGVGKSTITASLACAFAAGGWRVGVLDADINGPTMAKMLGVRGRTLVVAGSGVEPPASALGVRVMSMDLLLSGDETPVAWRSTTQAESHTWRGSMEASALREFLADTEWGALDVLLADLPPGTDRLATLAGIVPSLAGTVIVTIPSDVSRLVVLKSITVARGTGVPTLGLVENMAGMFPGPGGAELARETSIPFLGSIPFDPELARACDRGEAFVTEMPERDAARALTAVAAAVREALERARG